MSFHVIVYEVRVGGLSSAALASSVRKQGGMATSSSRSGWYNSNSKVIVGMRKHQEGEEEEEGKGEVEGKGKGKAYSGHTSIVLS